MNKQILSLALALPAILATTVPALADKPIQIVQPQQIAPQVQVDILQQQGFPNPSDNTAPGPGGITSTPRGPKPPRRDANGIIQPQNLGKFQPAVINPSINAAPVQAR
jgi:hypothetical protein